MGREELAASSVRSDVLRRRRVFAVAAAMFGLGVLMVALVRDVDLVPELLLALGSGLIGSAVVVVLVEFLLDRHRRVEEERQAANQAELDQLSRQLRSPSAAVMRRSIERLRELGGTSDFVGRHLSHANLDGMDLSGIDLSGARLFKVTARGTTFLDANFEGSTMSVLALIESHALRGAVMRDGRRYDGRLRLQGDTMLASVEGANLDDLLAGAEFYGVDVTEYVEGQRWAVTHHAALLAKAAKRVPERSWWEIAKDVAASDG